MALISNLQSCIHESIDSSYVQSQVAKVPGYWLRIQASFLFVVPREVGPMDILTGETVIT
jgi:hypothetical protein